MKTSLVVLLLVLARVSTTFAQGTDSVLIASLRTAPVKVAEYPQDLFAKGRMDADMHYKKYKKARNGTFLGSVLVPFLGLIPAVISSDKAPRMENLGFPDADLMKSPDYASGYTQRAKQIKQKKIWKAWGLAFGVNVAALVVLANR